jgi:hypothetical protein
MPHSRAGGTLTPCSRRPSPPAEFAAQDIAGAAAAVLDSSTGSTPATPSAYRAQRLPTFTPTSAERRRNPAT